MRVCLVTTKKLGDLDYELILVGDRIQDVTELRIADFEREGYCTPFC